MNKLITHGRVLYTLTLLLLCSVTQMFARPITEAEARRLAVQLFAKSYVLRSQMMQKESLTLVSAPERRGKVHQLRNGAFAETAYYYIYNRGNNQGFVIVSGDDKLSPYIGYADRGRFATENMPAHISAFLEACRARIDELSNRLFLPSFGSDGSAHSGLYPTRPRTSEPANVAPLLGSIRWNQGEPWNALTPSSGDRNMPVGCVATAYTQVMRYHKWPERGEGSFSYKEMRSEREHSVDYGETTYDWANMPENFDNGAEATQAQREALATLAYHAGVAVEMMYTPDGSGTYTPLVARALREHFRYDKGVSFKHRVNYTQVTWEQMLRRELIAARPVVYSGSGSGGGHAFVCDGYNAEGLFHINWGWGGLSDGYFNLNYLVPEDLGIGGGAGGGFSIGQGAVVGIKPDRTGNSQMTDKAIPTTWSFELELKGGEKLRMERVYAFVGLEAALPYDGSITYAASKVGSGDTTYFPEFAYDIKLDKLYYGNKMTQTQLDLGNKIHTGTWDFFLVYRETNDRGQTVWRPCAFTEGGKGYSRHTYSVTEGQNGSYTVDKDTNHPLTKLELVEGSVTASFNAYERSFLTCELRNTGREEFAEPLLLFSRNSEGKRLQLVDIIPAIGAGETKRLRFDVDRCPYASGEIKLLLVYGSTELDITDVQIQPSADIRPAYTISPAREGDPLTATVEDGVLSSIRITNMGTSDISNRVYYHWILRKDNKEITSRWTQTSATRANATEIVTPNLKEELQRLGAQAGDELRLTAVFAEANSEGYLERYIPLLETPELTVRCTKKTPVVGSISMTTDKNIGETISVGLEYYGGLFVKGVEGAPVSGEFSDFTLTAKDVAFEGDISFFACTNGGLTAIELSECASLEYLVCFNNKIEGVAMTRLMHSLPNRTGKEKGFIAVYNMAGDHNKCYKSDVAIARAKNWVVVQVAFEDGKLRSYLYEGLDDPEPQDGNVVTMTTQRAVGEQIVFAIEATSAITVQGIKEPVQADGEPHTYTLTSQTVTIQGSLLSLDCSGRKDVDGLDVNENKLTALDISGCKSLQALNCSDNPLGTLDISRNEALRMLICYNNALSALDLSHAASLTKLICFHNKLSRLDLSRCADLELLSVSSNELSFLDLSGNDLLALDCSDNQISRLDLSQSGSLEELYCNSNQLTSLDLSHNVNLKIINCRNNQLKGKEMTRMVNSLPMRQPEDYASLTVVSDTETEGNFCLKSDVAIAKSKNWLVFKFNTDTYKEEPYEGEEAKTFAVTLTKEGEGTLTATGADDLNAVPEGAELTIEATPAAGYKLTALTANGTNILSAKKLVVTEATEVKAKFTKDNAADIAEESSARVYPNPAGEYVNVKGAKANALVRLYDADGALLYEGRTDDNGALYINLSVYAAGIYSLCTDGEAQRIIIRR